jgi:ribosomal protein L11 methyltransferase
MNYIEISFIATPEQSEILIALLSGDFESFEETVTGVKTFVREDQFSVVQLQSVLQQIPHAENIVYTSTLIAEKNWNALWESNFEPVWIGSDVYVRAPFHTPRLDVKYEIVIEPKMSFGTGHHATTSLMIAEMMKMNLVGEDVLDMGCGSGILAILAAKSGARNILAIDIDEWAYKNAFENCIRNQSQHIIVQKGDASLIRGKAFDVILANINRNILLENMNEYVAGLKNEGHLLISGITIDDLNNMIAIVQDAGLTVTSNSELNGWVMVHFQKAVDQS